MMCVCVCVCVVCVGIRPPTKQATTIIAIIISTAIVRVETSVLRDQCAEIDSLVLRTQSRELS